MPIVSHSGSSLSGKVRFLAAGIVTAYLAVVAAVAQDTPKKPNVVVIVLDQLRADQLHCYGNPRDTSPNIDQLAASGALFTRFNTVAPWTSPSFSSLHTSLYPSRHGVTLFWRPGMPLLNKDIPTLAENLQAAGYYTTAFVNNSLAGYPLTGSGFDEYYERSESALDITIRTSAPAREDVAATTEKQVLQWLGAHHEGTQPFFLYVHFMEPHSPYNPPPEDDIFKSGPYSFMKDTGYDLVGGALLRLATNGDQDAIQRLYQLYDGKIHHVDRYVGDILNQLKQYQLDKNTYIVLTSDHGELLYSHPEDFLTFDHRSLYDADLHVPLIIAGPGIPQGEKIESLASNVDTAPTILDLVGAAPLNDAEGHSLAPVLQGKVPSINKYLYAEEDVEIPLRSVRDVRYKLIRSLWTGKEQLFDMQTDPGELHDVAANNPAEVQELEARLNAWMKVNEPTPEIQQTRWKIYTQPEKTVIVDDVTTGARFLISPCAEWHSDENPGSGNYDGSSFWTEAGSGSKKAIWRGDNPLLGTYKISVYVGRPKVGTLATNAPYKVVTADGSKTVLLDLKDDPGTWKSLGTFKDPRYVELSDDANGVVVADAVKFDRLDY